MDAAGVYQPTPGPSLSIVAQLPHVFVYPPAEEGNKFYCVFRGGPFSTTPFHSFYPDSSASSRGKFGHDLYRHDPFQQSRVVRTRTSQWDLMYDTMTTSHDDDDDASCRSSSEAELDDDDECLPVESQEHDERTGQYEDDHIPARPASRRSSVFGSRPSDPSTESHEVHAAPPRNFPNSFRTRAMTLLKRMGRPSSGNEASTRVEYDSWFDLETRKTKRKRSQNDPHQSSSTDSSQVDTTVDSNATISSKPPVIPKLSRKKSVLERFRFSSGNDNSAAVITTQDASLKRESFSHSLELVSPSIQKLSRRHSVSRFFGSRGTTDLGPGKVAIMPNRPSDKDTERPNRFIASGAPATIVRPESSNASTARSLKRQSSFFRSSNISVDALLHRDTNEESRHHLPRRFNPAEDLEKSSEQGPVSSSIPRSSDSLTLEEELQSPIQTTIPTIVLHHCDDHEISLLDDDGFLQKDIQMEVDDGPFGLDHGSGARHRTVVVDPPPMLDLAVHLNSLTFDTLAFDPDVFENTIDDDA